jgi:ABC-2 type transport system permease protein
MKNGTYSLIVKEFLAVWQDKKSRLLLILPPLVQLFIFAFAATLDVQNISLGILNLDSGKQAYELTQRFQGSTYFPHIKYLRNVGEIKEVIDNQKVMAVIFIHEQFSRNLLAYKKAQVELILDGRKSNSAQIVQGYVMQIIQQYNDELAKIMHFRIPPSIVIQRSWFNPNLIYQWFTVPGLVAILLMFTTIIITALSIARERELGTFEQLLVSPLRPIDILIGKSIPGIVLGMGEGSIILIAAITAFQIPLTGSLLLLYFSMFIFVCSIVGIGICLSAICKTQQQALLAVFVFMSNAVILSGFGTPIDNMPNWLQNITLINPLRYFLVIVRSIFLKDMSAHLVLMQLYPIAIIAIFNLIVSTFVFRRRLE